MGSLSWIEFRRYEENTMVIEMKKKVANPFSAIRHANGYHARVVANKKAYRRNEKHRNRRFD